ncbi:MAG: hypothetical protein EAZ77_03960 [Nostocales cyanobacterium]|nr:MAG: hypothetical protein EAZ77_03960 [Nostocales cyanobacterium]
MLYQKLSQSELDYVLQLDDIFQHSNSLIKPEHKTIIVEGKPTSAQTKCNTSLQDYIDDFKNELKTQNFSHVFSGRIKINFQWHLRERDFFENPNVADLDNLPIKKIIDELRNPLYGLFIDDIQVDEINLKRIILPLHIRAKYNDKEQQTFEKLVINIDSVESDPENCYEPMIKRDDIGFISLEAFSDFGEERLYPIAKSETAFNTFLAEYFKLIIIAEQSIDNSQDRHSERLRHITTFPKHRINSWLKNPTSAF